MLIRMWAARWATVLQAAFQRNLVLVVEPERADCFHVTESPEEDDPGLVQLVKKVNKDLESFQLPVSLHLIHDFPCGSNRAELTELTLYCLSSQTMRGVSIKTMILTFQEIYFLFEIEGEH